MSVVFVLVFAAIILAGVFLIAFIWSVKNGQYEDTYTPSVRMLFDDPELEDEKKNSHNEQSQLAKEDGKTGKSYSGTKHKDIQNTEEWKK
jgi:cbb3-type cytochrome oxidase maturation protein